MESKNLVLHKALPLGGENKFVFGNYRYVSFSNYESHKIYDNETRIDHDIAPETLCQYIGFDDVDDKKIFSNDILKDHEGKYFRVYQMRGGFVKKANYWQENLAKFIPADELIAQPLSDAQTISYIRQNCKVVGNAFTLKNYLETIK